MMFSPVGPALQIALGFFLLDTAVRDVLYSTENGQDVLLPLGQRVVQAAVDPGNSRSMERIFGGSISDGDIGVTTMAELYFTDQYAAWEGQRQSFVTYQGIEYRVENYADWNPQAGIRVYLAKRHVKQNEVE